jgi:hypothetical protein
MKDDNWEPIPYPLICLYERRRRRRVWFLVIALWMIVLAWLIFLVIGCKITEAGAQKLRDDAIDDRIEEKTPEIVDQRLLHWLGRAQKGAEVVLWIVIACTAAGGTGAAFKYRKKFKGIAKILEGMNGNGQTGGD